MQSKSWTFTLYVYDEASLGVLQRQSGVSLLCYQEEKCPSTGRLHIQGYCRFDTNRRLASVKKFLADNTAHCETAKGTPQHNLAYCTKPDSATGQFQFQLGDFGTVGANQGKRNDLDEVVTLLQAGETVEAINLVVPKVIIKYGRGVQLSRQLFLSAKAPAAFSRVCICLWGRSGSGKSQWAREYASHRGLSIYSKPLTKASDVQWFDGYDGEQVLLLDDFTDSAVSFRELLIWTDIYKSRIQVKGSMALAQWSHVIFTSNGDPSLWYTSTHPGVERDPLTRRLDHLLEAPADPLFVSNSFDFKADYPGRSPPASSNYLQSNGSSSAEPGDSKSVPPPGAASGGSQLASGWFFEPESLPLDSELDHRLVGPWVPLTPRGLSNQVPRMNSSSSSSSSEQSLVPNSSSRLSFRDFSPHRNFSYFSSQRNDDDEDYDQMTCRFD